MMRRVLCRVTVVNLRRDTDIEPDLLKVPGWELQCEVRSLLCETDEGEPIGILYPIAGLLLQRQAG